MNSKTFFLLAALCGGMFASCVNDEITDDDGRVRFTAGIHQAVPNTSASRAAGDTWGNGDAIGVFMVGHGTTTISEGVENNKFTTTGSSAFTAVAGQEVYYPMDGSEVDFIAYYPHRDNVALNTDIDIEIGSQSSQASFDLLWGTANNTDLGFSKLVSGAVNIPFQHKLAKITLNCKAGDGVTNDNLKTGMTVKIKGMNTTNTFSLATGTLGTAGTVTNITPRKLNTVSQGANYAVAYDAIIMPGTYAANDVSVVFTIGSDEFTWESDAVTFTGGNEYIYDVTITRTGVSMTGTILAWTTITKGSVTAD
ncbi:fimbrillin family protein [Bacteroides sp. OttesenSCG-928-J23]|nr:fimbrillin family protein [Bacteroides sp. OttesenSCG-928-J23]MDL2304113.1 fimbrillin family protein [Bacteroides sp. OttesenSCG-928-D19]